MTERTLCMFVLVIVILFSWPDNAESKMLTNTLNNPDTQVQPLLKAQEQTLVAQVPSFLKEAMPESPSKIFNDYATTGDPILKQKAGDALNSLTSFVSGVTNYDRHEFLNNSGVSTKIPDQYRGTVLNSQNGPDVLTGIMRTENINFNPKVVRTNTDGSNDYGLMQINSSMLPFVKKQFKAQGKQFNPFDPQQSIQAADMILTDNKNRFKAVMDRDPTADELAASYNKGITVVLKKAREQQQIADAYAAKVKANE